MVRWIAALVLVGGCRSSPGTPPTAPASTSQPNAVGSDPPPGCGRVEQLVACVDAAIPALQREPAVGALEAFVRDAQGRGVGACQSADATAVRWSVREESIDHFDDGAAALHRVYSFDAEGCDTVELPVTLHVGS